MKHHPIIAALAAFFVLPIVLTKTVLPTEGVTDDVGSRNSGVACVIGAVAALFAYRACK